MKTEIWKDIQGYEGIYQISNLGRVRTVSRFVVNNTNGGMRFCKGKIMSHFDNGNGYKVVTLSNRNHRKNYYLHRLVATAFVKNPYGKKYVNHIDFNTSNNKAENLEWCTQKENVLHSVVHMKKPKSKSYSNTGNKYVYMRNNKYRVCIPKMPEKQFDTLIAALFYKSMCLGGD